MLTQHRGSQLEICGTEFVRFGVWSRKRDFPKERYWSGVPYYRNGGWGFTRLRENRIEKDLVVEKRKS